MSLLKHIRNRIDAYTIGKKKVYILPTKFGFTYTAIMFTLFLIGLTYANNLTLLLSFFMFTYYIIQMLQTHKSIQLLQVKNIQISDGFSDTDIAIEVYAQDVIPPGKYYIHLSKQNCDNLKVSKNNLSGSIRLQRGSYHYKFFKFSSTGVSQLFYVWKYIYQDTNHLVFPTRRKVNLKTAYEENENINNGDAENYLYHIPFNTGLNAKRIDWKKFAKTDQLYWKKYSSNKPTSIKLDYYKQNGECEERLSILTYQLEQIFRQHGKWTLILPNMVIKNASNQHDYTESLKALAEVVCD